MRVDLEVRDGRTRVCVVLSRRNLLALMQKLSMPGSARTLFSTNGYRDGEMVEDIDLVVSAEDDESHYSSRDFLPGAMHPVTDAVPRGRGRRREPELSS